MLTNTQDHLIRQVLHRCHALAQCIAFVIAKRAEHPHFVQHLTLTAARRQGQVYVPHHPAGLQMPMRQVEKLVARIALGACIGHKAAGFILHGLQR